MTRFHRDAILEIAPQKLHSTFTLTEASRLAMKYGAQSVNDLRELRPQLSAGDIVDVTDPINQGPEVFATVGAEIAELLPPILELCRDPGGGATRE